MLYNAVLLSKPVLWKAERGAEGNADAHGARPSVRGAYAQSRRRAHRPCDDAKQEARIGRSSLSVPSQEMDPGSRIG
jgi:hypothetical protein